MYCTNPDTKFLFYQALLFVQVTCIHNIYNNTSVISKMANRIWRWEVFLPSLIRILKNRQKWQDGQFRKMRMYKGKEVWEYKTITVKLSMVAHTFNNEFRTAMATETLSQKQKQTLTHKTTTQQTGRWRKGQVGGDIQLKES